MRWVAVGLVAILVLALAGTAGWLLWRVRFLEREVARRVEVVTEEDLSALERRLKEGLAAEISREVGGVRETLRLLEGRVLSRTVERGPAGRAGTPGPAGPPGAPGSPQIATPGTPLIPPAEQPEARRRAIERVRIFFDPGSLAVSCRADGIDPDAVELLRDAGGRLLSTSPCVRRVDDEVVLREAPPSPRLPYNLAFTAGVLVTAPALPSTPPVRSSVGLEYQNWLTAGTIYRVSVDVLGAERWILRREAPEVVSWLRWVVPLR